MDGADSHRAGGDTAGLSNFRAGFAEIAERVPSARTPCSNYAGNFARKWPSCGAEVAIVWAMLDSRLTRRALLQALVSSCATPVIAGAAQKAKMPTPSASPRTWPLPPETPRIRFVTAYRGIDAFKPAKKPSRFMTALLGDADPGDKPSDNLLKPYGVAVTPDGRICVTDTAARRVFVFDPERKTVGFLGEDAGTPLNKPVGIAADETGRVFVADATVKRVFAYEPDGRLALAIGHDGDFETPSGLTIDRTNRRLFVADTTKHQIFEYTAEDGRLVRRIGTRGVGDGQFNFPTNVWADRAGLLYVADTLNFRVQIFDADGRLTKTFGELGDGPGTFNRPKGIAVDSEGHIYVVDSSFSNFQIFTADGQLLLFVGSGGQNAGEFVLPAGMCIDEHDRVYVADQGNARVQIFQYLGGVADAARGGAVK